MRLESGGRDSWGQLAVDPWFGLAVCVVVKLVLTVDGIWVDTGGYMRCVKCWENTSVL